MQLCSKLPYSLLPGSYVMYLILGQTSLNQYPKHQFGRYVPIMDYYGGSNSIGVEIDNNCNLRSYSNINLRGHIFFRNRNDNILPNYRT